jgi:RHS repeat-associated protein
MFASMEFDSSTGLYYDHARYYDAAIGRFVSQDPMGFAAGDTNLYRYLGNDPSNDIVKEDITNPSGNETGTQLVLAASRNQPRFVVFRVIANFRSSGLP